ncbi:hypothetical protein [Mucilaginibacter phyllosphaerae]|uniref:Uncharacterized protein n=1 Tax=Mucilaginibacter phyllosphaerae TaxID=1812349 RepID=A0A4Y8AJB7_9SPHI|nr:hypothetical protein [Mucilaginibacter phyllosphaerae]MBB3971344.1 hypothetical protein [Mucilaginibacter phyllosphaerae]TEW68605.1 hypothetical protein E2R65_00100 [Mucilaginibacter phyllosphaerae]GGH24078.1 hypothetical protein GCM10007352_38370 [Mucilaginibacter phyllosphaerae]
MKNSKVVMATIVLCFIINIVSINKNHNLYNVGFPNVFYQKTITTGDLGLGETHHFFILSFIYNILIYLITVFIVAAIINCLKPEPDN